MSALTALPPIRDERGKFLKIEEPKSFNAWLNLQKTRYDIKTDAELSIKLGIPASVISRIYAGKQYPSAMHTQKIIDNLGLVENTVDYNLLLKLVHKTRYEGDILTKKVKHK